VRPCPISSTTWRAIVRHGLADLSPPEAAHALLELPTNRSEYVAVVQDLGDWPARSPIGQRVPTDAEIDRLTRLSGKWRAVVLLDDERALRVATTGFSRSFVLDPLFDSGELVYAAWHDPAISTRHAERLATQASLLVRAGPMLRSNAAVLAPDHLPGSWDPRPGWRPRIPHANPNVNAAWSLRTAFVLLYWADRLDALVCTSDPAVARALSLALDGRGHAQPLRMAEPAAVEHGCAARQTCAERLIATWRLARRVSRRRTPPSLRQLLSCLEPAAELVQAPRSTWTAMLGPADIPDPALLIRRVLNGENPRRDPPLPRRSLRRRPLCLLAEPAL
jgi:hypothetical protein